MTWRDSRFSRAQGTPEAPGPAPGVEKSAQPASAEMPQRIEAIRIIARDAASRPQARRGNGRRLRDRSRPRYGRREQRQIPLRSRAPDRCPARGRDGCPRPDKTNRKYGRDPREESPDLRLSRRTPPRPPLVAVPAKSYPRPVNI